MEVLEALTHALTATGEVGRVLTILGELARVRPESARYWEQLARIHLDALRLPEEALRYADAASARDIKWAALVRGDALSALGRHDEAIAAYTLVGHSVDGTIHLGEAYLRAGQAEKAQAQAEKLLSGEGFHPQAVLLRGCAAYALGDLPTARAAFEQVASSPEVAANAVRAMACFDLGLTCLRLTEGAAAESAFHACTQALEAGSPPGPSAVESVSPTSGLALVALGRRGREALSELDTPPDDAPRAPALRLARAVLLASQGDVVGALREARICLVLAPDCAYACSLCSELLARQALNAERTGASAEHVHELAKEAFHLSRQAVSHSDGATPFGELLRQRDAALRGASSQAAPAEVVDSERTALGERRDRDAALRLLRLAQRLGPDDRVISGIYARALLARYAGHANADSVLDECVQHAQRILQAYGKDPDFARKLPPEPAK